MQRVHQQGGPIGTSEKTKSFQIDLAQQKYYLICLKTYMLQIWRIKIEFNMSPKAKIKIIMCSYGSAHICGKTVCLRFAKVFPSASVRLRDSRRASCICISFTVFFTFVYQYSWVKNFDSMIESKIESKKQKTQQHKTLSNAKHFARKSPK